MTDADADTDADTDADWARRVAKAWVSIDRQNEAEFPALIESLAGVRSSSRPPRESSCRPCT